MALFAWVGGATAATGTSYSNGIGSAGGWNNWLLPFDWNNPNNWYERRTVAGVQGWYPATRSPSALPNNPRDIAYFGEDSFIGWTSGNPPYWLIPQAKAPCLFGGVTMNGSTASWPGGGTMGGQYNGGTYSSLQSISVGSQAFVPKNKFFRGHCGQITTSSTGRNVQYPFSYIGGGIAGLTFSFPVTIVTPPIGTGGSSGSYTIDVYAYSTAALEDAARNGFTMGGQWMPPGGSGGATAGLGISYGVGSIAEQWPGGTGYGSNYYWNYLLWTALPACPNCSGTAGIERLNAGIRLKVDNINATPSYPYSMGYTGTDQPVQGVLQVNAVKNLELIPGATGSSAGNRVKTNAYLHGTPEYVLSGHLSTVTRYGITSGAYSTAYKWAGWNGGMSGGCTGFVGGNFEQAAARRHLTLRGATVGTVTATPGINVRWITDKTSNIGQLVGYPVDPKATSWILANRFDESSVFADLGLSGATGTGETIKLTGWSTALPGFHIDYLVDYEYINYLFGTYSFALNSVFTQTGCIFIGDLNTTIDNIQWGEGVVPTYIPMEMPLRIGGSYKINTINFSNGTLRSTQNYSAVAQIGEIVLKEKANIWLRDDYSSSFPSSASDWRFGKKVGNIIEGGIIFDSDPDLTPDTYVVMGQGVRLWNDQLDQANFRSGYAKRQGKSAATTEPTLTGNEFI